MAKETRNNGPALSLREAAYPCVCNDVGDGGVGGGERENFINTPMSAEPLELLLFYIIMTYSIIVYIKYWAIVHIRKSLSDKLCMYVVSM